MGPEERYDQFSVLIQRTVSRIVWDFPEMDKGALADFLWKEVLDSGVEPDQPGLRGFLYRKAKSWAWTQRREHLRSSAQYSYRTEEVKLILETFFEDETCWVSSYIPRDAREGESDQMAGVEIRLDVSVAFQKLSWDHQDAIILRYRDNLIPERRTPEQRRLSRAVKALAEVMNSYG